MEWPKSQVPVRSSVLVRYSCGHLRDGDAQLVPPDARLEEARRVVRAPFSCPACASIGGR